MLPPCRMKAVEDVARMSALFGARYPGQRFPDIAISRLKTLDRSSGLRRTHFHVNLSICVAPRCRRNDIVLTREFYIEPVQVVALDTRSTLRDQLACTPRS